ncbi:MAG: S24/S26 family peptidase [Eubacterium sp.]|nr:S24/S26 family peptidase [Eubacterium sp.]
MTEYTSIKEILEKTGTYTGLTVGVSMQPLLHEHRDNIIVVRPEGRLEKYDVALYVTARGKYIMHRVIEVHNDHYIIMGDNLLKREYVTDDMICGKLIGFYKNGKRYVDCENSKLYKFYSKLIVAIIPIKPALFFVRRGLGYIKRKILKLFGKGK